MRILSLCRDAIACEFTTRLAVDAGLAVRKAELEPDDPLARRAPGLHAWLSAGKERVACVTADLPGLVAACDAVVTDEPGRALLAPLAGARPLIVVGERDSAALAGLAPGRCDEFLAFHGGGLGFLTPRVMPGYPSAGPLCPDAHLVEFMTGLYGAIALFAQLRAVTGANAAGETRVGYAGVTLPLLRREIASVLYDANDPHRSERIWKVSPAEIHRCRDGWVFVNAIEDHQWQRLCAYMGRADLATHPDYATRESRFAHADAISAAVDAFFADRPQSSWQEAQRHGVPVAAVNAVDTLLTDPQLQARGFWQTLARATGAAWRVPASPLARLFGAGGAAATRTGVANLPDKRPGGRGSADAPLAGLRVLEFTHVWSGPFCGQILADLGAEVIRVENRKLLDIHRRGGPYAGGQAGLNRSGTWNAQNRGKLGCTLDVKTPEGRALFLDLARASDVVIENFAPGALDRLGLGHAALLAVNPRIILLRLSGYGQTGPYRDSLAYGPMMDAATGLSAATTYADGLPRAVNGWAADIGGALHGAAAVTRVLLDRPAEGVQLDISQFEAGVLFNAAALIERANGLAAGEPVLRVAVESAEPDCWLAISLASAAEFAALRNLDDWVTPHESTPPASGASAAATPPRHLESLEAALRSWVATRTRDAALTALRAAGIPAVPVTTTRELIGDQDLRAHGSWLDLDHPEAGRMTCYGPPIHLPHPPATRPAPLLGGDNATVFGELLGIAPDRLADLAARGIV